MSYIRWPNFRTSHIQEVAQTTQNTFSDSTNKQVNNQTTAHTGINDSVMLQPRVEHFPASTSSEHHTSTMLSSHSTAHAHTRTRVTACSTHTTTPTLPSLGCRILSAVH